MATILQVGILWSKCSVSTGFRIEYGAAFVFPNLPSEVHGCCDSSPLLACGLDYLLWLGSWVRMQCSDRTILHCSSPGVSPSVAGNSALCRYHHDIGDVKGSVALQVQAKIPLYSKLDVVFVKYLWKEGKNISNGSCGRDGMRSQLIVRYNMNSLLQ